MKTSDGAKNGEVRVGVSWRRNRRKYKEDKRGASYKPNKIYGISYKSRGGIPELREGSGIRVGIY